jgi:hypothetical protein
MMSLWQRWCSEGYREWGGDQSEGVSERGVVEAPPGTLWHGAAVITLACSGVV